ncbi:phytoene/squalene synthase family protein [Bartonella tamiae]|nr:phytoene/squalene synthase family protein [Bartonella tamiae]
MLLRHGDRDRYLATLFAPQSKRSALAALYAFNLEIARIRDMIREPLIGEIRLKYWRDAIENDTRENDANPILQALLTTIDDYHLSKEAFVRMCDARVFDLYNDPMPDMSAFEAYCGETASIVLQLSCQILDQSSAKDAYDACGHGGVVQAIAGLLRRLPVSQSRGQFYLPTDFILALGVTSDSLLSNKATDKERKRVVDAFLSLGREHYRKFRANFSSLPKILHPAFLPLATVPTVFKKIETKSGDIFHDDISLSPLHHYWLFMKTAILGHML